MIHRPFHAALVSVILLSSPILAYYGISFLPDTPAFCLILGMTACLFRAEQVQQMRWVWLAAILAALALMLKLSMAIFPFAMILVGGIGFYQTRWRINPFWRKNQLIWPVLTLFITVLACRYWIFQYNLTHHAHYFFNSIRPIWWYDRKAIFDILKGICFFGAPAYASAGLYLASVIGLLLIWRHRKSIPVLGRKIFLFTTLFCLIYILLWFRMLREHDYYAICLMVLPAIILIQGIQIALKHYSAKSVLYALSFFGLLGIWHSHYLLNRRLQEAYAPRSTRNLPPDAFLSNEQLSLAGIPVAASVLCPEDPSPNIALMALKRKGWTGYNFGDKINADSLQKYREFYGLSHLALRDTLEYNALYRSFFPNQVLKIQGWYLYQK